jgi:hypothetical protein
VLGINTRSNREFNTMLLGAFAVCRDGFLPKPSGIFMASLPTASRNAQKSSACRMALGGTTFATCCKWFCGKAFSLGGIGLLAGLLSALSRYDAVFNDEPAFTV